MYMCRCLTSTDITSLIEGGYFNHIVKGLLGPFYIFVWRCKGQEHWPKIWWCTIEEILNGSFNNIILFPYLSIWLSLDAL